jgi:hypothetical protein
MGEKGLITGQTAFFRVFLNQIFPGWKLQKGPNLKTAFKIESKPAVFGYNYSHTMFVIFNVNTIHLTKGRSFALLVDNECTFFSHIGGSQPRVGEACIRNGSLGRAFHD